MERPTVASGEQPWDRGPPARIPGEPRLAARMRAGCPRSRTNRPDRRGAAAVADGARRAGGAVRH